MIAIMLLRVYFCHSMLLITFGLILSTQDDLGSVSAVSQFQKAAGLCYRRSANFSIQKITIHQTTYLESGIRKQLISFRLTDQEDEVPVILLVPPKAKANGAAVLCLPDYRKCPEGLYSGDSCVYAKELTERGYVTLVPDYPGFGKYDRKYNPYIAEYDSCTMKGIHNHIAAINILHCLTKFCETVHKDLVLDEIYVDPQRIGCIGHGSGGYNALFFAIYSNRIGSARVAAVGISSGLTTFKHYNHGMLGEWSKLHLMPWIASKFNNDPKKIPFDFPQLLSTLAPLPVFISAPLKDKEFAVAGARECIDYAEKIYAQQGLKNRIETMFPDCGQEFPKEARDHMYEFLDRQLLNPARLK